MMEMTFRRKFGETEVEVTLEVPTYAEALPATQAYIWHYGMLQSLSDSYAAAKDEKEFDGKLRMRLDKILKGEMKIAGQRGPKKSELEREIESLGEAAIAAILAKKSLKVTKEAREKYVTDYIERFREELTEKAQAEIARRAELVQDVELPEDFFGA